MRNKFVDFFGVDRVLDLVGLGGDNDSNGKPLGAVAIKASADLSGVEQLFNMIATVDSGAPSGAADVRDDATGYKAFTVTIDPITTLAAGESIVVGYDTVSGNTGVETNAKNCSIELSGTRTGSAYTSVVVLNANRPSATIIWDGVNTIKRIVPVTSDAADRSVTLVTVG